MKFRVIKTSDWNFKEDKEFNTLEELINWIKEINQEVIISLNHLGKDVIEIYDSYRE